MVLAAFRTPDHLPLAIVCVEGVHVGGHGWRDSVVAAVVKNDPQTGSIPQGGLGFTATSHPEPIACARLQSLASSVPGLKPCLRHGLPVASGSFPVPDCWADEVS